MLNLAMLALLMQLPDTVAAVGQVAESLGFGSLLLFGVFSAVATAGVRSLGTLADRQLGTVDQKIRTAMGPTLPVIALAWGALGPVLANKIGLTSIPSPDVFANAPLAGLAGIVIREATVKWLVPFAKKIGGVK